MDVQPVHGGWEELAEAWIASQGGIRDWSRAHILDPAMEKLLSSIEGLRVLDVGCGEGRYARVLARKGAVVTGIDPIAAFVDRARSLDPSGTYVVGVAEEMPFPDRSFDIVVSYLSIIDIPDYRSAAKEMARVMARNGKLVVATCSNLTSPIEDWHRDESGRKLYRIVDRYMEVFAMDLEWNGIRIRNYHRPMSAILDAFFQQGLVLDGFIEPLPSQETTGYVDERRCPSFQIMTLRFA